VKVNLPGILADLRSNWHRRS